eukprot:TRINITY_DN9160_c0_g1_i2.p1 TRINITY_DN9160_c0_g1~~TRINITY_DN9160_c0_g1_i2.p1  ORF type:complete len:262 (+),score=49.63 TRINITY_DN9160_c0_g1_i2:210-995(+)
MDNKSKKQKIAPSLNGTMTSEKDSISSGLGSKSKPCTKFFSISGCPYGESCHFMHYIPGGVHSIPQITVQANSLVAPSNKTFIKPDQAPGYKTQLCVNYKTAEGCRFGSKCTFAHGEEELRKEGKDLDKDKSTGEGKNREAAAANFGDLLKTKISIDASYASAIIGKGGANTKHIHRVTGAKMFIRDHESDPALKNVEFEGSLEQVTQATLMVRELIKFQPAKSSFIPELRKTKLCENYAKGSCSYGEKCHFAHGQDELKS